MEEKIDYIKKWLGTGSINIFGIQFSGKDTVGERLAGLLDAEFISSGDIIRRVDSDELDNKNKADKGLLTPTKEFSKLMESYLVNQAPSDKPLVLSSVGRWIGEEQGIMKALNVSAHPLKVVIKLNISKDEVWKRWKIARDSRNGGRIDDANEENVETRLKEFREKTLPVIEVYREIGLLIEVDGEQTRDEVFSEAIDKLSEFIV